MLLARRDWSAFGQVPHSTKGGAMFAPKVAKTQSKAAASSTNSLAHDRSTLVAHSPGHSPAGPALFVERTIGNQALLRLMAQRDFSPTGEKVGGHHDEEAERRNLMARASQSGIK